MQHKRILVLTNRVPYPLKDGGNLAMKAMIDGYHTNGWEVCLLCMNTTRHHVEEAIIRKQYDYINRLEVVTVYNDVRVISTLVNYLFSKEPNHAMRFRSKEYMQRLLQVIQEFQPQIIQIESIYLSTYIPEIRKATNAKLIARLHNVEYQIWHRLASEVSNPIKRAYLKDLAMRISHFERESWQQYDLLLPITENDNEEVKSHFPGAKTYVLPFTIEASDKQIDKEDWVGYHIGAMDWLPNNEGITWFIKSVWQEIIALSPNFEFYYAGRNMPEKLNELKIAGTHNCGEVESAESFMADKKILIVPLRSGGGIRVKILESLAARKVVISTDIGMQGIDVKPCEHYLPANTPQEFANAVHWCLNNKEEAEKVAISGQVKVLEQYNSEAVFSRLNDELASNLL